MVVSLVAQPPVFLSNETHAAVTNCSLTLLANSTAIRTVWASVGAKYDMLYSRRAFVHWFVGEGMEEGEMTEARENLASIEADYREIGLPDGEVSGNASNKSDSVYKFRPQSQASGGGFCKFSDE
ncbi:unnamed protein product [Protopolystoma xenopodis]|uniref:Tubulin/FtsZ 2-layer sandwich domain-containing protein n=1 Tax=Protopolystoma xenopodis TaxID=117903 RepID=A0A448WNY4_9PLAT|nr:unnamed protein product [Protopolystoma xenopodis]